MPEYGAADPEKQNFTLRFGGGLNARQVAEDIEPEEASFLENIDIDVDRKSLRRRMPLVPLLKVPGADDEGTAPITAILGPIPQKTAVTTDSTSETMLWENQVFLIQSLGNIYHATFLNGLWVVGAVVIATVDPGARLHFTKDSFSEADGYGIITDLNKIEVVKQVSLASGGVVSFIDFPHNLAGTTLYAKYSFIQDDRLWLANITTKITATSVVASTPHLIVASQREVLTNLSVANRASSALGDADPFYIPTPDLKEINGVASALGYLIFSTRRGSIFSLVGFSAKDFYMNRLYAQSGASGDLSVAFAGNDILYYSAGAVESVAGTEAFGSVEVDDFSRPIRRLMAAPFPEYAATVDPSLEDTALTTKGRPLPEATLVYYPRKNLIFVMKKGDHFMWVMNKSFHDQKAKDVSLLKNGTQLSPWCKWTEDSAFDGVEPRGLLGNYTTDNYTATSNSQLDKYYVNPIVATPADIKVPESYTESPAEFRFKEVNTILFGGPDGVVYYLDPDYDEEAKGDYPVSNYIPDGTGVSEPDLTAHVETCKVKYRSKIIKAPSLKTMKELSAIITYQPRHTITPALTMSIEFQGLRRRTVTKTVTLENHPLPDAATGGETVLDHAAELKTFRRSERVSFPCTDATEMQIYLEWDDNLVEIVEIDFNVLA